jgi:hypothetical protein
LLVPADDDIGTQARKLSSFRLPHVECSDLPADIARLLGRLRDGLLAHVPLRGVYLYGSLATGDFSPARSDIDVVVMVADQLDRDATSLRRSAGAVTARLSRSARGSESVVLSWPGRS